MVTLFYLLHGFICCILEKNYLGIKVDIFMTYFYNSIGWYGALFSNLSISINRFSAIAFITKYKSIWTTRRVRFIVLFCLIVGLLTELPVILLAPEAYIVEDKLSTAIAGTTEDKQAITTFNLIWSIGFIIIVMINYIITVCLSVIKRKSFINKKSKYIRDLKLLIQGIIVGIMLVIAEVAYYFPIFGDLSFFITSLLSAGLNPVIYFIIDSNLRKRVKGFFMVLKKNSNVVFAITKR